MIEKIKIENLTVFEDLEIDTNAPINVFIGENGTGKTQILRFIYLVLLYEDKEILTPEETDFLSGIIKAYSFHIEGKRGNEEEELARLEPLRKKVLPSDEDVGNLAKKADNWFKQTQFLNRNHINTNNLHRNEELNHGDFTIEFSDNNDLVKDFVFIPAKDMLTHSKGLPEMKKEYGNNMPFDETYIHIIEKAKKWNKKDIPEIAKNVLPILEDIMDGIVKIVNDVFYIQKRSGQMIPFDFEAEGIKKIGLLWQLLMNGSITKGTVLLWDEPETNINPTLSPIIANMLLELSRSGVQIFLTTHSYFLAKYFDILEKEKGEVVFHSLYREDENKEKPVICETSDTFSMLANNDIIDEKIRIYKTEMEWEF